MEGRALSRPHSVRRGVAATTERGPPPTTAKQSILSAKVNKTDFLVADFLDSWAKSVGIDTVAAGESSGVPAPIRASC